MAVPPYDDQLVIDLEESVTYTPPGGFGIPVASATVDEESANTIFAGFLGLVSRDALITIGKTQLPTRPVENGTITDGDGNVWQIVSAINRKLGNFWEINGRDFSVPGGLTQSGNLGRRDNTATTTNGLSNPVWSNYESGTACLVMPAEQGRELTGEDGVVTTVAERVVMQGYREMRAADRFTLTTDSTTLWEVESIEPYDPSFGCQVFRATRRI